MDACDRSNVLENIKNNVLPELSTQVNDVVVKTQTLMENHETIRQKFCELLTSLSENSIKNIEAQADTTSSNEPEYDFSMDSSQNLELLGLAYNKMNNVSRFDYDKHVKNNSISDENIVKYDEELKKLIKIFDKTITLYNNYANHIHKEFVFFNSNYLLFKAFDIKQSDVKNFFVEKNGLTCFKFLHYMRNVKSYARNKEKYKEIVDKSVSDDNMKEFLKTTGPSQASSILNANFKFPTRKILLNSNISMLTLMEFIVKQHIYLEKEKDFNKKMLEVDFAALVKQIVEYWDIKHLEEYLIRDALEEEINNTKGFQKDSILDQLSKTAITMGAGRKRKTVSKNMRRSKKQKANVKMTLADQYDDASIMESSSSSESDSDDYTDEDEKSVGFSNQVRITEYDRNNPPADIQFFQRQSEDGSQDIDEYTTRQYENILNFKELLVGFDESEANDIVSNFFQPFASLISTSSISYSMSFNNYSDIDLSVMDGKMSAKDFMTNITSFAQIWKMMDIFLSKNTSENTKIKETYLNTYLFKDLTKSLFVISCILDYDSVMEEEFNNNNSTNSNHEVNLKRILKKFKDILFPWELSFRDVAVFIQLIKDTAKSNKVNLNISELLFGYVLNSLMVQPHYLLMTIWIFGVFEQYINNNNQYSDTSSENYNNDIFARCASLFIRLRSDIDQTVAVVITSFIFIKISDFLYALTSKKILYNSDMSSEHLKKIIIEKTGRIYVDDPDTYGYATDYMIRYIQNFQSSVSPSLFSSNENDYDYMIQSLNQVNIWARVILNKITINDVFSSNCERQTDPNAIIFGALFVIIKSLDNKKELLSILNNEVTFNAKTGSGINSHASNSICTGGMCQNPSVNSLVNDIEQYSGMFFNKFQLFAKLNCLHPTTTFAYIFDSSIKNVASFMREHKLPFFCLASATLPSNITASKTSYTNFFRHDDSSLSINPSTYFLISKREINTLKYSFLHATSTQKAFECSYQANIFMCMHDYDNQNFSELLYFKNENSLEIKHLTNFVIKHVDELDGKISKKLCVNDWFFIKLDVNQVPDCLFDEPLEMCYLDGQFKQLVNREMIKNLCDKEDISSFMMPIPHYDLSNNYLDPQYIFDKSMIMLEKCPLVLINSKDMYGTSKHLHKGQGPDEPWSSSTLNILTGGSSRSRRRRVRFEPGSGIRDNCDTSANYTDLPVSDFENEETEIDFDIPGLMPLRISKADSSVPVKTMSRLKQKMYTSYDPENDKILQRVKKEMDNIKFNDVQFKDNEKKDTNAKTSRIISINQNILMFQKMCTGLYATCATMNATYDMCYNQYYDTLMFMLLINSSINHFMHEENYKHYIFDEKVPSYLENLLSKDDGYYTIYLDKLRKDLLDVDHPVKKFFDKSTITRYFKLKLLQSFSKFSSLDNTTAFIFKPVALSKSYPNFYIFIFIIYIYHLVNNNSSI